MSAQTSTAQSPTLLAAKLAQLARSDVGVADLGRLRALTLANLAGSVGERGSAGQLISALATGTAHRLAMRLHARTQDDFFPAGRVHVGAVTLAAALALAERTGDRLLTCLAGGYRVMCAVSATYSALAQWRGLRPTGMFGPMAAAATAGLALEQDCDRLANSIGLATTMSAGTNQAWISGSDEWLLEVGAAARAGVEAAVFSEKEVRAAGEAFEGPAGWCAAFFDDAGGAMLERTLDGPPSWISEVRLKPYPVSGIAQVPTHLACRARARLGTRRPERIEVRLSRSAAAYPGSANRGPFRSRSDALMSVAFCVACGLTAGAVRLEDLERPSEAPALELMTRVELVGDATLAEEECVLICSRTGSPDLVLSARGEEILRPDRATMGEDPSGLAGRTQSPQELVRLLRDELASDRPRATTLVELIGG